MTKGSAAKANPLRYIQRVDNNHHAWKVAIRRMNQRPHQYFTDADHGGTAQALVAAMAWRDAKVVELTGVDYALWKRERLRPTNTSGIVGVYRGIIRQRRGQRIYKLAIWSGYWRNIDGKRSSRSFSVGKYGEQAAKALAIRARREGMKDVARQFEMANELNKANLPTKTVVKATSRKSSQKASKKTSKTCR